MDSGFEVLGLEGFDLESQVIRPRLDLIRDFSLHGGDPLSTVADFGSDVWIDVTLKRSRDKLLSRQAPTDET